MFNGKNIFLTGAAGTGKSYLLRYLTQKLLNRLGRFSIAKTAPTGIAAININGVTIHSFSGVGTGHDKKKKMLKKVIRNEWAVERWKRCKVLVLDEISMISSKFLDKLEFIARRVRENL